MKSAAELCGRILKKISGKNVGTIITDSCGRSLRRGETGNAIRDFRGDTDLFGYVLKITGDAVVEEIAGFSNCVMGESNNDVPAAIFRNCGRWAGHDNISFTTAEDITKHVLKKDIPKRTGTTGPGCK